MKNKKLMIGVFTLLSLFLIGISSAEISIIKVKTGDCVRLRQSYCNSTYQFVTKIVFPNQTISYPNYSMNKVGCDFEYNFCDTNQNGEYEIGTTGDVDGINTSVSYTLFSSPSGNNDTNNLVFIIFIIVIIYTITLIGFFGKNEIITLIGGMFMIGLSVYIINQGIIVYRDWITNYFSYITLALGSFVSIMAGMSLYQDL